MDILRLVDIDENDYSIKIQFEITMVWKEKRAKYMRQMTEDQKEEQNKARREKQTKKNGK